MGDILGEPELAGHHQPKNVGTACKDVEARKTKMAGPVSFSRWLPADSLAGIYHHRINASCPARRIAPNHFIKSPINCFPPSERHVFILAM
jgi:hypothetical protein